MLVYRPLGSYPGAYFGYEITMTMYALCVGVAAFASFKLIHLLRGDDATEPWTLLSEAAICRIRSDQPGYCGVFCRLSCWKKLPPAGIGIPTPIRFRIPP